MNKAYELISSSDRWDQGCVAARVTGEATRPESSDAVRWCAAGAIQAAYPGDDNLERRKAIYKKIVEEIRFNSGLKFIDSLEPVCKLVCWNDWQGRTWKEVYEVLKKLDV